MSKMEAISFANGYFTLVDGLGPNIQDYLAEDIKLEWFGRLVSGRAKVANFMRVHMKNSKHIFNEIEAIESMDPEKCGLHRKYKSEGSLDVTAGKVTDERIQNELSFGALRVEDEEDSSKSEKMDVEGILQEEQPAVRENGLLKFVEARGAVQFDRRAAPNKIRKRDPNFSARSSCCWRRSCVLRVAYSTRFRTNGVQSPQGGRKMLKSSEVVPESISGRGAADFEPFRSFDCHVVTQLFIECFEAQRRPGGWSKLGLATPNHLQDRLTFDWNALGDHTSGESSPRAFRFNYSIHSIIYLCDTECKLDLSVQFSQEENSEEDE